MPKPAKESGPSAGNAAPPMGGSAQAALEHLGSLDAQLAAFADDLIAGDFEDMDGGVSGEIAERAGRKSAIGTGEALTDLSEPSHDESSGNEEGERGVDAGIGVDASTPESDAVGRDGSIAIESDVSERIEASAQSRHDATGEAGRRGDRGAGDGESRQPEAGSPLESKLERSEPGDASMSESPSARERAVDRDPSQSMDAQARENAAAMAGGPDGLDAPRSAGSSKARAGSSEFPADGAGGPIGKQRRSVGSRLQSMARAARTASVALSGPMLARPPIVRRAASLIALWTMALAAFVLFSVLTRSDRTPTATKVAPSLETGTKPENVPATDHDSPHGVQPIPSKP